MLRLIDVGFLFFKMKKFIREIYYFLHPSFHGLQNPYNAILDEFIRKAIDQDRVVFVDQFTCKIGDIPIWISNYPYASGVVNGMRPSRSTLVDLINHILRKFFKMNDSRENSIRFITGN